ncbi:hypothetical protein M885DRAFT_534303 [Pelagophyceae sp. CCMP2097]|nr:hypothetical protein M885DRAFT_534303 [Pelagophyceae sp. CCMP2097]
MAAHREMPAMPLEAPAPAPAGDGGAARRRRRSAAAAALFDHPVKSLPLLLAIAKAAQAPQNKALIPRVSAAEAEAAEQPASPDKAKPGERPGSAAFNASARSPRPPPVKTDAVHFPDALLVTSARPRRSADAKRGRKVWRLQGGDAGAAKWHRGLAEETLGGVSSAFQKESNVVTFCKGRSRLADARGDDRALGLEPRDARRLRLGRAADEQKSLAKAGKGFRKVLPNQNDVALAAVLRDDEPVALCVTFSPADKGGAVRVDARAVGASELATLRVNTKGERGTLLQRWVKPRGGALHDHHLAVVWRRGEPHVAATRVQAPTLTSSEAPAAAAAPAPAAEPAAAIDADDAVTTRWLLEALDRVAATMARELSRHAATPPQRLDLVFKLGPSNELFFLWCQAVHFAQPDKDDKAPGPADDVAHTAADDVGSAPAPAPGAVPAVPAPAAAPNAAAPGAARPPSGSPRRRGPQGVSFRQPAAAAGARLPVSPRRPASAFATRWNIAGNPHPRRAREDKFSSSNAFAKAAAGPAVPGDPSSRPGTAPRRPSGPGSPLAWRPDSAARPDAAPRRPSTAPRRPVVPASVARPFEVLARRAVAADAGGRDALVSRCEAYFGTVIRDPKAITTLAYTAASAPSKRPLWMQVDENALPKPNPGNVLWRHLLNKAAPLGDVALTRPYANATQPKTAN